MRDSSRALKRARSGDVLGDKAAGNRLQGTSGTAASTSSQLADRPLRRQPDHPAALRHEGAELHANDGTLVAFTRCWGWSKGFPDDPSPKEKACSALLAGSRKRWSKSERRKIKRQGHSLHSRQTKLVPIPLQVTSLSKWRTASRTTRLPASWMLSELLKMTSQNKTFWSSFPEGLSLSEPPPPATSQEIASTLCQGRRRLRHTETDKPFFCFPHFFSLVGPHNSTQSASHPRHLPRFPRQFRSRLPVLLRETPPPPCVNKTGSI